MSLATLPVPGRGQYRDRTWNYSSRSSGGTGCGFGGRGGSSYGHAARGEIGLGCGARGTIGAGVILVLRKGNNSNTTTTMMYSGGVPGPTGLAVGMTDSITCFHLLFSHDVYDELFVQTNLY